MDGLEVRTILARNIKVFRAYRSWSQADLAEKTGLSIIYLSDIERGNKWPYLDTMVKLAEAFKIEVYELIKPERASSPNNNTNLTKFTEEIIDILSKNLKIAEKNVSLSLTTLQDKYLAK